MSCSTGLHNAIKKILNKKPWYRYIIQGNNGIIHLLNNSKANINYYTSYDAAVVIASHINDSINNGEKIIGDIAFPKRDYTKRGIVVIEPLNAQLDLLNTEDSAEISRLQSKIQTESEIKEQEEKSINKEEDANILNNNIETIREWLKQGMEEDTFWQKVEELGVSKAQINTFKGVSNDLQTDIQSFKDFVQGKLNSVKPGVEELFNENPELVSIGTPEQYSQYLDTIFPDSKVEEIDNSLYISVLKDLQSNKIIEKQCS